MKGKPRTMLCVACGSNMNRRQMARAPVRRRGHLAPRYAPTMAFGGNAAALAMGRNIRRYWPRLEWGSYPVEWCRFAALRRGLGMSACESGHADDGIIAERRHRFQRHISGALDRPFVVLFEQDGAD